jgi:peptidyl-tRNA hydrolase, PTH1 family
MNASGDAVGAILRYYKLAPGDLIAVVDDADLPLGRIRVRPQGGSGGHKGLESIIRQTGTEAFPRVRVGIGRDPERRKGLVEYVLTPLSREEQEQMAVVVDRAALAVLCIADLGAEEAMNRFNGVDALAPRQEGQDGVEAPAGPRLRD